MASLNDWLKTAFGSCTAIAVLLLALEVLRYAKKMYYSASSANPRGYNSILNRKYQLDRRENVDEQKINLYMFLFGLFCLAVSYPIMLFAEMTVWMLAFFALNLIGGQLMLNLIGKKYQSHPLLSGKKRKSKTEK